MSFESPETIEQKRAKWNETLKALDNVVDKRGRHIDPGIKETVAALRCSAFETEASCEGHLDTKFTPPWVDISFIPEALKSQIREQRRNAKDSGGSAEVEKLIAGARMEMFAGAARLMGILDDFYSKRHISFDRLLIIRFFPDSARLQNQGAEIHNLYPSDLWGQKLREFQDEMAIFTDFLRERFFSDT